MKMFGILANLSTDFEISSETLRSFSQDKVLKGQKCKIDVQLNESVSLTINALDVKRHAAINSLSIDLSLICSAETHHTFCSRFSSYLPSSLSISSILLSSALLVWLKLLMLWSANSIYSDKTAAAIKQQC